MTAVDHFAGPAAERYDVAEAEMFAAEVVEPTVDFLAELAGGGAALELGIGTGRIALPLAARGVRVAGIDLSRDMVAQLRAKPGGGDIHVEVGDFSTVRVAGSFSVAYVVFNTINNLITQDSQIASFANAASHLEPGGCFVVEVGVPTHAPLRSISATRTLASTSTTRRRSVSSRTTSRSSTRAGSAARFRSVRSSPRSST